MMNKFFTIVFMTLATISVTYSQVYERIYENSNDEVRAKLNQNKIAGIDILTGVVSHHDLKVLGMNSNNKSELTSLLENNNQITTFTFSGDLKSLTLTTTGHITKEIINNLLEHLYIELNEYTVSYSINE